MATLLFSIIFFTFATNYQISWNETAIYMGDTSCFDNHVV